MKTVCLRLTIACCTAILMFVMACSQPSANKKEVKKEKVIIKQLTFTQTEMDNSMENFDRFDGHVKKHKKQIPGAHGEVIVRFTANADGSITGIEIAKPLSKEADNEALRLVRSFSNWIPNTLDGKAIGGVYTIPITFK
jgi:TonB family protein